MSKAMHYVRNVPLGERFWPKVNVTDDGDCWDWMASVDTRGYGNFGIPRGDNSGRYVMQRAHRIALQLSGVEIPDGYVVMHTCDNRKCCNPSHLRVGTQSENMLDCSNKQRMQRAGEANSRAKLTDGDVLKIRSEGMTVAMVMDAFNVSKSTAHSVVNGATWKHVQRRGL